MRDWVDQARSGSIRAATRLITMVEDDPSGLAALFHGFADWPAPRLVLGVTGPPGAGKSTLVDGMLSEWRHREPETRLGVLAVDPSSPFTGGAILGDRVRMMRHATDPHVFIRSLASRGHLGGLTLGIRGAVRIMALAGCDIVIIETVGIGQSEVEVASVADITMVVLAPGQGDGVQMLKAGVMEAGDVFAVNKADRADADRLLAELRATLAITGNPRGADVYAVSAVAHTGIDALVEGLEARATRTAAQAAERRAGAVRDEVRAAVLEAARRRLERELANGRAATLVDDILEGRASVDETAAHLLSKAHEHGRIEASARSGAPSLE
mgnify:CR=1 FL=1